MGSDRTDTATILIEGTEYEICYEHTDEYSYVYVPEEPVYDHKARTELSWEDFQAATLWLYNTERLAELIWRQLNEDPRV